MVKQLGLGFDPQHWVILFFALFQSLCHWLWAAFPCRWQCFLLFFKACTKGCVVNSCLANPDNEAVSHSATCSTNEHLGVRLCSKHYVWICPGTTSIPVYRPKHTFDLKNSNLAMMAVKTHPQSNQPKLSPVSKNSTYPLQNWGCL